MKSCGRCVVRKHRNIKKGEHYIFYFISSNLDCLEKRKVISSESRDYMGIPGKGLTTYLYLRTKIPDKKEKARFFINDITNENFRKFLKGFINLPYLSYKSEQIRNEPNEAYFFLIGQVSK